MTSVRKAPKYGTDERKLYIPPDHMEIETTYGPTPEDVLTVWRKKATIGVVRFLKLGEGLDLDTSRLVLRENEVDGLIVHAMPYITPGVFCQPTVYGVADARQLVQQAATNRIIEGPLGNHDQVA